MAKRTKLRVRTRLWDLRRRAGLSQGELALRAKVSRSRLCMFERGHATPSPPVLRRLAAALGVSVAELTQSQQITPSLPEPEPEAAMDIQSILQRIATDIAQIRAILEAKYGQQPEKQYEQPEQQ